MEWITLPSVTDDVFVFDFETLFFMIVTPPSPSKSSKLKANTGTLSHTQIRKVLNCIHSALTYDQRFLRGLHVTKTLSEL